MTIPDVYNMNRLVDYPSLVFALAFSALWLSACCGAFFHKKTRNLDENQWTDFGIVQAATLTLLGLIIGFTFSMSVTRYDERKKYEAEEANAIGTEYLRADLLGEPTSGKIRESLGEYLQQRILFYTLRDSNRLNQVGELTDQLQKELWSTVQARAAAQPTPTVALAASGMNDVLNSRGYTQAARWNRIPVAAWVLLFVIAMFGNLLIGYGSHGGRTFLFLILPLAVSISFFLIADIDSPRGGIIRVQPLNLIDLAKTVKAP